MRVPSLPRNTLLAQFLRELPGYMERVGSGIRLMINEMHELDLPEPEFVEQHEFIVIFRNNCSTLTEDEVNPQSKLNERQLTGLKLIQAQGSLNNSEYREATGATERTALRDLADMVELGLLITKVSKRSQRYYLP